MEYEMPSGGLDPKAMNIILGIAGFLVLLYIIALIVQAATRKTSYSWPPWKSKCPDYWSTSRNSNGDIICTKDPRNKNGLDQRCSPLLENGSYVGNSANVVNMQGLSVPQQCEWAKNCQVIWENVDNKC